MAGKTESQNVQYNTIMVRLYPTPEQEELFRKTFDSCRFLWNQMLSDHEKFYLETDAHFIPTPAKYKKFYPFLTEVDNQTLIQERNHLEQAFRNFFKNPADFGYPRFKRRKDAQDSFTAYNHICGNSATIYITKNAVRMTKAGLVQAVFPRRPRSGWRLLRLTVKRTRTGKYLGYLLFRCPVREPVSVEPTPDTTIGLKYSIRRFYETDGGEGANPPHWLRQSQEKLTALQKRLNHMTPGSQNYQEAVQKYHRLHEKIADQRRDFLHKESTRIANEWNAVAVREDPLDEIARTLGGKDILDSGFGMFREMLRYKLTRQGKKLITVDRYAPTTKTCSVCGAINETISPKARRWTCPVCKTVHSRGKNAAKNIKNEALLAMT